ncbi:MAG: GNAT family N-acetyltransferase [Acidobacteria bacterium]|nr:GNAT family N-acetyltransferase [Acidobacteriota bacterium]
MTDSLRILGDPADVLNFAATVQHEADQQRTSLGFLPHDAYRQAALQGKLLIAVDEAAGRTYAGHLMFGGSPPTMRVFQVFVSASHRRRGVGALLVNALVAQAEKDCYLNVVARVAADLTEANEFWQRMEFLASGVCSGGMSRNRSIVVRERRLNTPSLFDLLAPSAEALAHDFHLVDRSYGRSPAYGIDLNVLLDLIRDRPRATAASRIFSAALSNLIRLFVAPEFAAELRRAQKSRPELQDDTLLDFALALPQHPPPPSHTMTSLELELGALIFPERSSTGRLRPRDRSDVRHIATAIHNRVVGYVTSEEAILRRRLIILAKYGLDVIAPVDLAESLVPVAWEEPPLETSVPQSGEEIRIAEAEEIDVAACKQFAREIAGPSEFVDHAVCAGTVQSPRRRLLITLQNRPAVFISWDPPSRATPRVESVLMVRSGLSRIESVVEQALFHLIRDSCKDFPMMVRLCTFPAETWLEELLVSAGFRRAHRENGERDTVFYKLALGQAVTDMNWMEIRESISGRSGVRIPERPPNYEHANQAVAVQSPAGIPLSITLGEFEELVSPAIIAVPGRPGAIVPIRHQFSTELLVASTQRALFPALEAAFRGRRAYFCSPRALSALSPGSLLFFYESLKGGGRGAVIACARSVETFVRPKADVQTGVRARGVLANHQFDEMTRSRDIGVVLFDSVLRFKKAIDLGGLRQMGCADRSNVVTARRIDSRQVLALIAQGEPCV